MTARAESALLLIAQLPADVQAAADRLRSQLAPMAMLRMPAHCALFRHLPGPSLELLATDLKRIVRAHRAPQMRLRQPVLTERSVAIPVHSGDLLQLRAELEHVWGMMILPMERGGPRLHITLASGLARAAARDALAVAQSALRKAPFIETWLPAPALCLLPHESAGQRAAAPAPLLRAVFRR